MNYRTPEKSRTIAEKLQNAHIIADCVIRLGTCEVTRRGMKQEEMLRIAELIKRAIIDEESVQSLRKDVGKLAAEFQGVEYCYPE
jgi:glycine hydroxymethyltransferase